MKPPQDKQASLGTNHPAEFSEADDDLRFDYTLRSPISVGSMLTILGVACAVMGFAVWLLLYSKI